MDSATPLQPLELAHELDGLADRHQDRARMFLGIALLVIGLGIVAVMVLPPVIAALDTSVERSFAIERLQADINARTDNLQSILDKQRDLVAALNKADQTLGEIWQRLDIRGEGGEPQQGLIEGITAVGDGLLAYGTDSGDGDSKVLLLKGAADGTGWQRLDIRDEDGKPQRGRINGISAVGNVLLAYGADSFELDSKVLLLKGAADGTRWQRQDIRGEDGEPTQGWINGITAVGDGLLAIGSESFFNGMLLLKGAADGTGWQRLDIRDEDGKPQQGNFAGITAVSNGLLAYGLRGTGGGMKILLLKGAADGTGWQRQDIRGENGEPQQGYINGITAVGNGLLAYGAETGSGDGKVLLLKGEADGTGWQRQDIRGEDGEPQQGYINGITAVGGGLLAYGDDSGSGGSKVMLLQGAADGTGWQRLDIRGEDGEPTQGRINGISAVGNGLFAYGVKLGT
jgi:hypothetical protein